MADGRELDRWTGRLPMLPVGVRMMLTAFLAIIGTGYLVAIANVYHTQKMADGREGLSFDDLRATYSTITVAREEKQPSRMLTMLHTAMREYVSDDDFEILQAWLERGGAEEDLDRGETGGKTPHRAIMRNCLRCHAESTGTEISKTSAFGPDEFTADYGMLASFVAGEVEPSGKTVRIPPQYEVQRLVLVSHVHMLAIPMFTLVVGLMFMMTRLPGAVRTVLTPLPMIALVLDFAGWWLARFSGIGVYVLTGMGLVFGVVFGLQLVAVLLDLWRPRREPAASGPDRLGGA